MTNTEQELVAYKTAFAELSKRYFDLENYCKALKVELQKRVDVELKEATSEGVDKVDDKKRT